jgi:DNA-binding NarL/FixJ family response regulator
VTPTDVWEETKVTHNARILLVEDFVPFLRREASLVLEHHEWQIVGEASDGLEVVQKAEELQPDVVLLDAGLPKLSGIEAARQILEIAPKARIIFVSQESCLEVVAEAFGVGARGYVLKTSLAKDLQAALEAVLGGRQFVSQGLMADEQN